MGIYTFKADIGYSIIHSFLKLFYLLAFKTFVLALPLAIFWDLAFSLVRQIFCIFPAYNS